MNKNVPPLSHTNPDGQEEGGAVNHRLLSGTNHTPHVGFLQPGSRICFTEPIELMSQVGPGEERFVEITKAAKKEIDLLSVF
jgi:hypothetical protein